MDSPLKELQKPWYYNGIKIDELGKQELIEAINELRYQLYSEKNMVERIFSIQNIARSVS